MVLANTVGNAASAGDTPLENAFVQIHSLQGKPEYNGQRGFVVGPLMENGRVPVDVAGQKLSLRPDNLTVIPENAYPKDVIKNIFDPAVRAQLQEMERKPLQKLVKRVPVIFDDCVRRRGGAATVDEPTFKEQLQMFTWGLFSDWDDTLWANVLLAGGAVLASLLPPPSNMYDCKPYHYDFIEVHSLPPPRP
jgi:hypothetical protein